MLDRILTGLLITLAVCAGLVACAIVVALAVAPYATIVAVAYQCTGTDGQVGEDCRTDGTCQHGLVCVRDDSGRFGPDFICVPGGGR